LQVETCPCDVHFQEYLQAKGVEDKVIFHFGTGAHHVLGKNNGRAGRANEILGITASPAEYYAYVQYIIDNPSAALNYKVIFGDIYTLTPRIIPDFDLVTLFHLCEYYDERGSAYAPLNDSSLLALFLSKLKSGGRIFFYKKSSHFRQARAVIEEFVGRKQMTQVDEYETLVAYGRPQPRPRSRGGRRGGDGV
jgi:SAM-dependent methyltransferase